MHQYGLTMSIDKNTNPVIISLDAVIAMTDISRRTWWRRIEKGNVTKLPADARGRTMLVFEEIRSSIALQLGDDDVEMLILADGGDALAQAEAGAMFALVNQNAKKMASPLADSFYKTALYWLELAAAQEQADAMHWLSILHSTCDVDGNSRSLSLMWLARASVSGHAIARAQIEAITAFPRG